MQKYIIILPTHSNYKNITVNFLQLLKKYWKECNYKIIISITGEKEEFSGYECVYNGRNASLIECILNAANMYKSNYYMCFLGDAFINKKINDCEIKKQLYLIQKSKIDYCSLMYVKRYKKEKRFNDYFRYINSLDRYSHNFVAFVVSHNYIQKQLATFKNDLDYEEYYLHENKDFYYEKHLIVRKNFFGITPGITKGKWDRINYLKLCRKNPEIDFEDRELQTWKETIFEHFRNILISYMPPFVRIRLKTFITKVFKKTFVTKD
ncbi:MAG: hypothetical protein IKF17_05285 [Clostridia bacterium]|nr:hypothetical protein [Clostridia bacterium]